MLVQEKVREVVMEVLVQVEEVEQIQGMVLVEAENLVQEVVAVLELEESR